MKTPKSIRSLFSLPGFVAASALGGVFGDRYARVIVLRRRKKRPCARSAGGDAAPVTISGPAWPGTSRWPGGGSTSSLSAGEFTAGGAGACT